MPPAGATAPHPRICLAADLVIVAVGAAMVVDLIAEVAAVLSWRARLRATDSHKAAPEPGPGPGSDGSEPGAATGAATGAG